MPAAPTAREKQREAKRLWSEKTSRENRDIGALPWVADPARRAAAAASFQAHCESYHPETFYLGWCDDHLKVIGQIETSVRSGGLFATAMPRGSGKTSLAEVACEWATLHGYHPFACLIGSDEGAAESMLDSIKTELEVNDRLAADFPEVCLAVAKLDGIANRCKGQTYGGVRTRIEWTAKAVVLPTLRPAGWGDRADHAAFVRPDGHSLASGAVVKVAGITGGIRGMKHKCADGRTVRPTLVVPDDPQTDASARSPSQCATRERILAGAILGLAGPGKKISGVMPCTVIARGDVADNLLDRGKHPEWNGTRTKMVYAFPTNEALWAEYHRLRDESLRAERGGVEATEFYRDNREAMDAGARVAWPERYNHDELSALQHAMNLRFRDEPAFFAEYQNDPLPDDESAGDELSPAAICSKLNRLPRGLVSPNCTRLTAMVDVQQTLLYYCVCAWEDDFTGYILDYGAYPDQKREYFTLRDASNLLPVPPHSPGVEGRIYAGLEALTTALLSRDWPRDDGSASRIDRCLVDAGAWTDTVLQFCRQSAHAAVLTPSHGKYVGPLSRPFREYTKHPGDRTGHHWRVPAARGGAVRHVLVDTNYWKSFLHGRLAVPLGGRGCLSLFGERPTRHRLLADHLTAEVCRPQTDDKSGRKVDVWTIKPERPDNHWLDALVGCAVAASMQGVALAETAAAPAARKRQSFAELQARRRAQA